MQASESVERFALAERAIMLDASKNVGNVSVPTGFKITRLPAKRCAGSHTWALKGGMMGGRGGSCSAVTSGNGVGVVPMAYNEYKHN